MFFPFRIGSHSTSDDQKGYQDMQEVEDWKTFNDPVVRLRGYMEHRGLWTQVCAVTMLRGAWNTGGCRHRCE